MFKVISITLYLQLSKNKLTRPCTEFLITSGLTSSFSVNNNICIEEDIFTSTSVY